MTKTSRWLGTVVSCGAVLLAVGCGSSDSTSSTTSSTAAAGTTSTASANLDGKKVVLVSCATSNAFCATYNSTLKSELEAKGASVTVYENAFDPAKQSSDMNQAIAQRPDLIVLEAAAGSAPVVPAIKKAAAAGVPVMNVDGRADPAAVSSLPIQVLSDNGKLGEFAAQNLVEGMQKAGHDKGNVIVITGTKGSLITQDRMDAFNAYMAKYPQYKVVAVEDGNWDPVKTGQIASQLFAKYKSQGGIQGAYGMADYQAVPIAEAAKQAGIKIGAANKGLIITGSNCTKGGIAALKAGDIYGDATEDPPTLAKESANWAVKLLSGQTTPKLVYVKETRLTADNVDQFAAQCSGTSS